MTTDIRGHRFSAEEARTQLEAGLEHYRSRTKQMFGALNDDDVHRQHDSMAGLI